MVRRTLHELLLLLLIGVLSTLTAAFIDKSVDTISETRAHLTHRVVGGFFAAYLVWTVTSLILCALSAACVQLIGPSAAGSGIPQMKCVLAGVRIHDYLSLRTLVAKILSLILALGGGLSIGKEGPFTHISCCVANQLLNLPLFKRINANEQLRRQALAAACAAGVAATFGAPVGGVLFSIEVTASFYSINHLWKAMFTAVAGTAIYRWARIFGSLRLFDLTNFQPQVLLLAPPPLATARGTRNNTLHQLPPRAGLRLPLPVFLCPCFFALSPYPPHSPPTFFRTSARSSSKVR